MTEPISQETSSEKRPQKRYVLVDSNGKRLNKANAYTGKGPYQAAAKAARRLIEKRSRENPDSPKDAEIQFHVRAVRDKAIWSYSAESLELPPEKATYMSVETDNESGKRKRKRITYEDFNTLDDDAKRKVACHRRKIRLTRINKPVRPKRVSASSKIKPESVEE